MKKKSTILTLLGFLSLFLGVVILDQGTKYWSEKNYLVQSSPNEIHNYIAQNQTVFHLGAQNWLNFSVTYVRNTGAAWGLLGNLPENIRPYFFYVVTAIAMAFILFFFFRSSQKNFFTRLGIAFIFSGAMGNYIDRVWLHYVIDWIHFNWNFFFWEYDFPVFNIADSAVTCGVIILIIEAIYSDLKEKKKK